MNVITPNSKTTYSVFLAGTIDNGNGKNWQKEVIDKLDEYDIPQLTIFNPRRNDWNEYATEEEMFEQITWEQEHLSKADLIIMCILDDSLSPISLLELGQYAGKSNMIVFCSPKFCRYTNVKWICNKYNIKLFETNDISEIATTIVANCTYDTMFNK